MYVDVLIEHAFLGNQTLTYSINHTISPGVRVSIPLNGKEIVGFVMNVHDKKPEGFDVKEVIEVIDHQSVINEELHQLAPWMAWNTVSPLIRCLQTILPNKLTPKSSSQDAKLERIVV